MIVGTEVAQESQMTGFCDYGNEPLGSLKEGNFLSR
jgi:hypothetical protein